MTVCERPHGGNLKILMVPLYEPVQEKSASREKEVQYLLVVHDDYLSSGRRTPEGGR
jgi:hypothetical protein